MTGRIFLSAVRVFVLAGPVNFSTSVQLVAPAVVVKGTLSITNCELYFEVDEDEPSFRAIDPKVGERERVSWALLIASESAASLPGVAVAKVFTKST